MASHLPKSILVVGVGRSGTSLAMQVLAELGVTMPTEIVPADHNNVRGTGEALEVRDRMVALRRELGSNLGFLPTDWMMQSVARKCLLWMKEYLDAQRASCEAPSFAIKFPLASVFLPLWLEAAGAVDLEMGVVWATRQAQDVCRSLSVTYDLPMRTAVLRYAERSYYALRDAPPNTLLLPYEGWRDQPAHLVGCLAVVAGIDDEARKAKAIEVFSQALDHQHDRERRPFHLPAGVQRFDKAIGTRLGRLETLLQQPSIAWLEHLSGLADVVAAVSGQENGPQANLDEAVTTRTRLLRAQVWSEEGTSWMDGEGAMANENRLEIGDLAVELPSSREVLSLLKASSELHERLAIEVAGARSHSEEKDLALAELDRLREAYADLTRTCDLLEESVASRFRVRISLAELALAQQKKAAEVAATRARAKASEDIKAIKAALAALKASSEKASKRGKQDLKKALQSATMHAAARDADTERHRSEMARAEAAVESLQAASVAARKKWTAAKAQHEQAARDLQLQIRSILESTSWRVTGPLRRVVLFFRADS